MCLWLTPEQRAPGTSEYVQGVGAQDVGPLFARDVFDGGVFIDACARLLGCGRDGVGQAVGVRRGGQGLGEDARGHRKGISVLFLLTAEKFHLEAVVPAQKVFLTQVLHAVFVAGEKQAVSAVEAAVGLQGGGKPFERGDGLLAHMVDTHRLIDADACGELAQPSGDVKAHAAGAGGGCSVADRPAGNQNGIHAGRGEPQRAQSAGHAAADDADVAGFLLE